MTNSTALLNYSTSTTLKNTMNEDYEKTNTLFNRIHRHASYGNLYPVHLHGNILCVVPVFGFVLISKHQD